MTDAFFFVPVVELVDTPRTFCRSGGMVDALGLGPSGEIRESSNLSSDTCNEKKRGA